MTSYQIYITFLWYDSSASGEVSENLLYLLKNDPALKMASLLILDLRNNFGGVFGEALFDSSMFLPNPNQFICFTMTNE
jgi:C-terminal processing protease CtpA/Prc